MFEKRAMLVELTIRQWTARKHDKSVSREVDQAHSASNGGRYNKQLIEKSALEPIAKQANIIRNFHYQHTLPWGNNGQRLLPSRLLLDYRSQLRVHRDEFNRLVNQFANDYPQFVQAARKHLGSMFDPLEYPSSTQIRSAFGVDFDIFPVPTSNDFRVDMTNAECDEIREQIESATTERQKAATKACYVRVAEVLQRMKSQCVEGKTRITTSLVSGVRDLTAVIDALNVGQDPELTRLGDEIRRDLLIDADDLRSNEKTRKAAGDRAAQILESMNWS